MFSIIDNWAFWRLTTINALRIPPLVSWLRILNQASHLNLSRGSTPAKFQLANQVLERWVRSHHRGSLDEKVVDTKDPKSHEPEPRSDIVGLHPRKACKDEKSHYDSTCKRYEISKHIETLDSQRTKKAFRACSENVESWLRLTWIWDALAELYCCCCHQVETEPDPQRAWNVMICGTGGAKVALPSFSQAQVPLNTCAGMAVQGLCCDCCVTKCPSLKCKNGKVRAAHSGTMSWRVGLSNRKTTRLNLCFPHSDLQINQNISKPTKVPPLPSPDIKKQQNPFSFGVWKIGCRVLS